MSKREVKALLRDQKTQSLTTKTRRTLRSGTVAAMTDTPPDAGMGEVNEIQELRVVVEGLQTQLREVQTRPDTGVDGQIQELRVTVEDLQVQLREAQSALVASDEQLTKVSGECERVNGEARAVLALVGGLTGSGPSSLTSVFQGFLESQAKLLAVQTNALAVQSAPPLASFTGEDIETETNSFERWLDKFEDRATMLSWTGEQKCYHIKQLLTKGALKVFDLLPSETRSNYSELIAALNDRCGYRGT